MLFLVLPEEMHPSLAKLNQLYQSGRISDNHLLLQEIEMFTDLVGETSIDPLRGMTNLHKRYPSAILFHECLRESSSGRAAYNIYLGKHNEHLGRSPFSCADSPAIVPSPENVNHAGLSVSS